MLLAGAGQKPAELPTQPKQRAPKSVTKDLPAGGRNYDMPEDILDQILQGISSLHFNQFVLRRVVSMRDKVVPWLQNMRMAAAESSSLACV